MKNKYNTFWYKYLLTPIMSLFGAINFNFLYKNKPYYSLGEAEQNLIKQKLKDHYYIILNHRSTHLTTYLIGFINWVKTGKWSYYNHAFINVDPGISTNEESFLFVEATASGVHYSTFSQVFDCNGVVFLRPKGLTNEQYTELVDKYIDNKAKDMLGNKYDNLFDLMDDSTQSCVEVVYDCLKAIPDYEKLFPNLIAMIKDVGNLTPQMFYDCPDLVIDFEIRR